MSGPEKFLRLIENLVTSTIKNSSESKMRNCLSRVRSNNRADYWTLVKGCLE